MLAAPLSPHHHHHAVAACLSLSLGRAAVDAVATQCGCCLEWNFIRLAWIQTAGREEGEQKGGRAEEGAAAVEEREGVWLGKIQMAANRDNERQVSRSGGAGRVQCPQIPAHTHTHRTQQTRACGNTNVAQPHPPHSLASNCFTNSAHLCATTCRTCWAVDMLHAPCGLPQVKNMPTSYGGDDAMRTPHALLHTHIMLRMAQACQTHMAVMMPHARSMQYFTHNATKRIHKWHWCQRAATTYSATGATTDTD